MSDWNPDDAAPTTATATRARAYDETTPRAATLMAKAAPAAAWVRQAVGPSARLAMNTDAPSAPKALAAERTP